MVPKHSALSLCRPFASRSMLMRNLHIAEPDTNWVCSTLLASYAGKVQVMPY